MSRVGKTRISEALVARHGYRHVELDRFVGHLYAVKDRTSRGQFRDAFYGFLLSPTRGGLVIEGDDLVIEDRWAASSTFGDEPAGLAYLAHLRHTHGVPVFVVGQADADPQKKVASLKQDDGWVTTLSMLELQRYAETLIRRSSELRSQAYALDLPYLEVGVEDFEVSVEGNAQHLARWHP
jgi:hypothetical protein